MKLMNRQSESERLLEPISNSIDGLSGRWTKGKILKASLVVGGVAALAAGSAGISSLRRRLEGMSDGA
jgi:hypothetical protein